MPAHSTTKNSHHTTDEKDVLSVERKKLGLDDQKTVSGIAISGGGIRSASFGLGVMQALVNNGVFSYIDYMSTVSGGGYLGSALTWALHQDKKAGTTPDTFPLGRRGAKEGKVLGKGENQLLDFIRQHGSYLTPTKNLDLFSFSAVVIRSMVMSLFVYFSFITILLTAILWFLYKLSHGVLKGITFFEIADLGKWASDFNQGLLLVVGIFIMSVMLLMGFIFSLGTYFSSHKVGKLRYLGFVKGQMTIGWLLKISLTCLMFGSLPFVVSWLEGIFSAFFAAGGSTLFGAAVGIWQYLKARKNEKNTGGLSDILIYAGAFALFYGVLLFAYVFATRIFLDSSLHFQRPLLFFALLILSLLFGFFVNLNLIGPHYLWRSRLMEAFLPDKEAVKNNKWQPATEANAALMEEMCNNNNHRPYHIVNTNLILTNSLGIEYSGRGGDNFIISPLFCGSDATGWKTTRDFQENKRGRMTLASAMAISAAALNPNAGVAGEGVTRNTVVSILLSMLNLRLGYWTSNPRFEKKYAVASPNFFMPGLTSEIFRLGFTEDNFHLLLSDGGHYENLGLYELIRRKVDFIIVSDGGADPNFNFDDLANAIEKVRVDFDARIYWKEGFKPDEILPGTSGESLFQQKYNISRHGFAMADIEYSNNKKGRLIYIKLAMINGLSTDVYSYKGLNPSFPHESTADQFFSEKQFEAYRELGYYVCWQMMETVEDDNGNKLFPSPAPRMSRMFTRFMDVRVNSRHIDSLVINFPIDENEVGLNVADILKELYEKDYKSDDAKDNFPLTGTAEANVEDIIYKFTYESIQYPDEPGITDFYVKLNMTGEKVWHSSTNIDKKGRKRK